MDKVKTTDTQNTQNANNITNMQTANISEETTMDTNNNTNDTNTTDTDTTDTNNTETEIKTTSPNAKSARGVSEDTVTTWVPFDASKDTNTYIRKIAKVRGVRMNALLASLIQDQLNAQKEQFDADLVTYEEKYGEKPDRSIAKLEKLSVTELEAYIKAQNAKLDKLRELAESKKSATAV